MHLAFPEIHGQFGFGFMRLPMIDDKVDILRTTQMVDTFLESGFNYFDTAHGYLGGQSEQALKTCLTSRYPRDRYLLTNKLSNNFFETQADIRPLFANQLEACGVEYFDFYLMHAQSAERFEKYKRARAYETALELKAEGKIRHLGISFHDSPQVLDRILTEYPQIEVVQIQFNYLDYDDPKVQSYGCYEVCCRHGKPVFVMEPVKGGSLVTLPAQAQQILDGLQCQLCHPFCRRIPGSSDGAVRHEHARAGSGKCGIDEGVPAPYCPGAGGACSGAQCAAGSGNDSLHRLPLLHGGLPHGDSHSGLVCLPE